VGGMASRKLSLVIDDTTDTALAPYLTPGTPQREATGLADDATDAAVLRELLVRGAAQLENERLAAWYQQFTADHAGTDRELAAQSSAALGRVLAAEAAAERGAA